MHDPTERPVAAPPSVSSADTASGSGPLEAETPASDSAAKSAHGHFRAGEVIAGRYEVRRLLGRGGMGEVYAARDRELGAEVALKTLRPEKTADPASLRRFHREIRLARKVTHPNVCRIFDVGFAARGASELVFFTMELLAGRTLARTLAERGPLPPAEARSIAAEVAAGLAAIHDAGIVHRDLKTENVILVPSQDGVRAVVTDFGLALGQEGAERSTTGLAGTPHAMAPEQVLGRPVRDTPDL
jgi:serine/threonine protein kinase